MDVPFRKLTEVPRGYVNVVPVYRIGYRVYIYPGIYPILRVFTLLKGRVRVWDALPIPRVLWHGRT